MTRLVAWLIAVELTVRYALARLEHEPGGPGTRGWWEEARGDLGGWIYEPGPACRRHRPDRHTGRRLGGRHAMPRRWVVGNVEDQAATLLTLDKPHPEEPM